MKTSHEIREDFIQFFKQNHHKIVHSAPVIPQDDPTLLFTNAGMNQFKSIFLNLEKPPYPRVADSQKCIRVSGKHNDLEEVGRDTYHHTFFEMLGNWSFGDYYKEQAIAFAWDLLTNVWKLPKERLWATVYRKDDESAELWKKVTDIAPDRLLRFGEKENFWEMGETGPCGPCSEIHYYMGDTPEHQSAQKVNASDPEYIELWNLVFIQYERDKEGVLHPLPNKHVDTGAGLERIVTVLQGKKSNYDTDLFMPIIRRVESITGVPYRPETGMPHRVLSDHVRMLAFAIADGGMPSNEGRGYVIRRILRRAARFGRMLNMKEPFVYELVEPLIDILGDVYPEIVERKTHIQSVIKAEEKFFGDTLDRGLEVFSRITSQIKSEGKPMISGADAFKLYDTYGFPLDLTQLMAKDENLTVDEKGFAEEMDKQRERAKATVAFQMNIETNSDKWTVLSEGKDSDFIGYEQTTSNSVIRKYFQDGKMVHLILDKTPFYAESGGEVGDKGFITGSDFRIRIENTFKSGQTIIHSGSIESGVIGQNPNVTAEILSEESRKIRANHTATHLLHAALRTILGEHVHQAGSLVSPERLRFDLTHYEKVTAFQLQEIERLVNRKIRENIPVTVSIQEYEKAKRSGAMALFGEKYGDVVRVITVGDYSSELCGGKHAERTGDIGFFRIVSESSVAAGVRRIEAVTGEAAVSEAMTDANLITELESLFNATRSELKSKAEKILSENKLFEREISKQATVGMESQIDELIAKAPVVGNLKTVFQQFDSKNMDDLKKIGDIVREKLKMGVGVLASVVEGRVNLVVVVPDETIRAYGIGAGDWIKQLGAILGGGGGGRPHLATAGGKFPEKIPEVFEKVKNLVLQKLQTL
ncbi:MAG: alanine--tRNA ligase [Candidatus Neomarinimicrobiota bacterium]